MYVDFHLVVTSILHHPVLMMWNLQLGNIMDSSRGLEYRFMLELSKNLINALGYAGSRDAASAAGGTVASITYSQSKVGDSAHMRSLT